MKRKLTFLQKKKPFTKAHLMILVFWGLGFLLTAHTVRVMYATRGRKSEFTITNNTSDWTVGFAWNIFEDRGDFNEWEWGNGHPLNTQHLPIRNSSGTYIGNQEGPASGTITLGPGKTIRTNIRAEFSALFGSRDDNYPVTFQTSPIKKPASLKVSTNGVGLKSIKIEWTKGTDMPDSVTKYKIQVNNKTVVTLSGDKRNYTITGLDPQSGYHIILG